MVCILTGRSVVYQFCFKTFKLQGLPHRHDKVALVMLYIFALGTVVFAGLEMARELEYLLCLATDPKYSVKDHIIYVLFLVAKVIFVGLQVRSSEIACDQGLRNCNQCRLSR